MALSKQMTLEESKSIAHIGYNIAHYRKSRNMTQDTLAERAFISKNTLSAIESATRFMNPTILILMRIADGLDIPVESLIRFDPDIIKDKS